MKVKDKDKDKVKIKVKVNVTVKVKDTVATCSRAVYRRGLVVAEDRKNLMMLICVRRSSTSTHSWES